MKNLCVFFLLIALLVQVTRGAPKRSPGEPAPAVNVEIQGGVPPPPVDAKIKGQPEPGIKSPDDEKTSATDSPDSPDSPSDYQMSYTIQWIENWD